MLFIAIFTSISGLVPFLAANDGAEQKELRSLRGNVFTVDAAMAAAKPVWRSVAIGRGLKTLLRFGLLPDGHGQMSDWAWYLELFTRDNDRGAILPERAQIELYVARLATILFFIPHSP